MTGKVIYMLIKIFDEEVHANAFFEQGEMYCRTLGDFKRIEGDTDRGDQYEGVTAWHQPSQISTITVQVSSPDGSTRTIDLHPEDMAGPVIMQQTWLDHLNLFCMYAMRSDRLPDSFENEEEAIQEIEKANTLLRTQCEIHDGISVLGKYAVVIHDVGTFVNRVRSTAKERGIPCRSRLVEYYDPETFHGDFDGLKAAFNKRNIYEHQNEYRFCFQLDGVSGPQKIQVGPLAGMAVKMLTKDLKSTLQLQLSLVKKESEGLP